MLAEEGRDREDDVVRLARELPDELPELRSKIFVRHERIVSPLTVGSASGEVWRREPGCPGEDRARRRWTRTRRRPRPAPRTPPLRDPSRRFRGGASSMRRVVRPVPDRDTTLGAELRDEAGLVVSRSDRLWLQAELSSQRNRGSRTCRRRARAVEHRRDLREPFRNAVDQHAAIGERPVDVEDEVLQLELDPPGISTTIVISRSSRDSRACSATRSAVEPSRWSRRKWPLAEHDQVGPTLARVRGR